MDRVGGDDIDRLLEDGMNRDNKRTRNRERSPTGGKGRYNKNRRNDAKGEYDEPVKAERRPRFTDRNECAVFICHLHPAVDDKDVFAFFTQCGAVRDIVLMRDTNSGTSKGYGYVEFRERESVVNALTTNGQYLGGSPVMVSVSNAEKNRGGRPFGAKSVYSAPTKLFVANIAGELTAEDLEPIFSAFGEVESVGLDKRADRATGTKSGFVEYNTLAEATFALANLKNISLLGKMLRISQTDLMGGANPMGSAIPGMNPNLLDEGQGGLQMSADSRAMLMQRLQASAMEGEENRPAGHVLAGHKSVVIPKAVLSRYVLLKNLFDPETETEPDWDTDIAEDVRGECSKFGAVESCIIDKNSLGHAYLTFNNESGAKDAVNQLNGRWFAQKQIAAEMLETDVFKRMCPKFLNK